MRTILVICFLSLAGVFFYEIFAPTTYYPNALETSSVRNAKLMQNAALQYQIDKGSFPEGALPSTAQTAIPICRYRASDVRNCFSLDVLVPSYLSAVPTSDNPTGDLNFTGFGIYAEQGQVRIVSILPPPKKGGSGLTLQTLMKFRTASGSSRPCTDLAGFWKLDESQDTMMFVDDSGNGNNGITFPFAQPAGPSTSVPKTLLKSDPSSWQFGGSGAVFLPNTPTLNITGAFTFSAWVNSSWKESDGMNSIVFGGRSEVDPFSGFAIGMTPSGLPAYFSNASPLSANWITGAHPLNDGKWHNLAVVVTETGAVTFYRDGMFDSRSTGAPPSQYKGTRAIGAASNATNSFPGLLDDVRLYARALTGKDIAALAKGDGVPCIVPVQHLVSSGSYICGTCSDRRERTSDCSCVYDASTNSVLVKGVSREPQRLGLTIGCPEGMTISQLSASYGENCTNRPAVCVFRYECLGQADCPVFFSTETCIGGAFPKDCPKRDGSLSFLCRN